MLRPCFFPLNPTYAFSSLCAEGLISKEWDTKAAAVPDRLLFPGALSHCFFGSCSWCLYSPSPSAVAPALHRALQVPYQQRCSCQEGHFYISKTTPWNSKIVWLVGTFQTILSNPLVLKMLPLSPREEELLIFFCLWVNVDMEIKLGLLNLLLLSVAVLVSCSFLHCA